ncbi:hypothetical protein F5884DRAFT_49897 [Xylogone sp. PMI_703]|nr:hypothetical protein F5884DRAFT_49897 [Xylogone sp. PMI_703]
MVPWPLQTNVLLVRGCDLLLAPQAALFVRETRGDSWRSLANACGWFGQPHVLLALPNTRIVSFIICRVRPRRSVSIFPPTVRKLFFLLLVSVVRPCLFHTALSSFYVIYSRASVSRCCDVARCALHPRAPLRLKCRGIQYCNQHGQDERGTPATSQQDPFSLKHRRIEAGSKRA